MSFDTPTSDNFVSMGHTLPARPVNAESMQSCVGMIISFAANVIVVCLIGALDAWLTFAAAGSNRGAPVYLTQAQR